MAHEFRLYSDPQTDIGSIQNELNSPAVRKATILPERTHRPEVQTYIDDTDYVYAHYYVSEDIDVAGIYDAIETQNLDQYVSWALLKYRQSVAEYRDGPQQRDPDYYRDSLNTGLRTDPDIRKTDHLELRLGRTEYRINGTNHTADYQTLSFDGHETTRRKVRIVGTPNGIEVLNGDVAIEPTAPPEPTDAVTLAILTLYPSEIDDIDTMTQTDQYTTTDWETKYNIGSVPEVFV